MNPLDEIDRRILRLLANDARQSVRAISRQLGMSAGAISERIDRLERAGVIEGYHATIDKAAFGYGMEVIVGLQTEQGSSLDEALSHIAKVPEVDSIRIVTGSWDVVLVLRVRDQAHLREVLLRQLWNVPGFRHSESLLVLEYVSGAADWFDHIEAQQNVSEH